MKKKRVYCKWILSPVMCLVLIFTFACASEEKYVGTYKSTDKSPPEFRNITVAFKKDGTGIRRVRGEVFSFEWEVRGRELRIHTNEGGILVGKMRNGFLEVSLPGSKIIYLKKMQR